MTKEKHNNDFILITSMEFPLNPIELNNQNTCEKTLKIGLMKHAENAVNTHSPKRTFNTLEFICANASENETKKN